MELKEICQAYTQVGAPVDEITRGAPLFATATWQPSNAGMKHVHEELVSVQTAAQVDFNAAYGAIGAEFNLKTTDMAFYAGRKEVPTNTVDLVAGGDINAYLAKQMTPIFAKSLMGIAYDAYYNVLRPFAKAKGQLTQSSTSSAGDIYCSMWFVRWEEDQMSCLVNDAWAQAQEGVFVAKPLSGMQRYVNSSSVSVYGVDIELPLGVLPANGQNIAGICNIDLATITDDNLSKLIQEALVRVGVGQGGVTKVYAHPYLVARVGALKEAKEAGINEARNLFLAQMAGVEFIGDYNLLPKTEAFYAIS